MSTPVSDTSPLFASVSRSETNGGAAGWGGLGRETPRSCKGETSCSKMLALGSLLFLRPSFKLLSLSPVKLMFSKLECNVNLLNMNYIFSIEIVKTCPNSNYKIKTQMSHFS